MKTSFRDSVVLMLWGFAIVMLVIYFRAFLAGILKNTAVFPLLFPDAGWGFNAPRPLAAFTGWVVGIEIKITTTLMDLVRGFMSEKLLMLFRKLAIVPVTEELFWRAPLWLTHRFERSVWWKTAAALSALGFTLSHQTGIMNLLVIFTAGLVLAWLVKKTGRLWPPILLHAIVSVKDF